MFERSFEKFFFINKYLLERYKTWYSDNFTIFDNYLWQLARIPSFRGKTDTKTEQKINKSIKSIAEVYNFNYYKFQLHWTNSFHKKNEWKLFEQPGT